MVSLFCVTLRNIFKRIVLQSRSYCHAVALFFGNLFIISALSRSLHPAGEYDSFRTFKGNSMDSETAQFWMREALAEARRAGEEGEVPVGAVLLLNGKVIGRGRNSSIRLHDPTAHAEVVALRQGAQNISNYRLPGSVLVVTIEPCVMCVGAMIQARIETLVYGAPDPKAGAVHSCFRLTDGCGLNHEIRVESGVLEQECGSILRDFFSARRNASK
jgi:tRNA(adenine34) deaminase